MMPSCCRALMLIGAWPLLTALLSAQAVDHPLQVSPPVVTGQPWLADPSGTGDGSSMLIVRYEQGTLSLVAHRVSLHSVLAAVAKRTGLSVDSGQVNDGGLVYVDLGPASVHDVLVNLLDGSEANYILLGSPAKPGAVERLILSPRNDRSGPVTQVAVQTATQPKLYGAGYGTAPVSDASPTEQAPSEEEPAPTASTAPPSVQNIDSSMAKYQQAAAVAAASGKSRAEILDELQKQQIKDLDEQALQAQPH